MSISTVTSAHPSQNKVPRQIVSGVSGKAHSLVGISRRSEVKAPVQVYHVRSRDDEEKSDVIAGMVELYSHLVFALIDPGPTHSFISTELISKFKL
ncbi:hypothetical protein GQ457_03G022410 [Hibiscus cannabinus]